MSTSSLTICRRKAEQIGEGRRDRQRSTRSGGRKIHLLYALYKEGMTLHCCFEDVIFKMMLNDEKISYPKSRGKKGRLRDCDSDKGEGVKKSKNFADVI